VLFVQIPGLPFARDVRLGAANCCLRAVCWIRLRLPGRRCPSANVSWRGWVVGSSTTAGQHLVITASPKPLHNYAKVVNGPSLVMRERKPWFSCVPLGPTWYFVWSTVLRFVATVICSWRVESCSGLRSSG
jgi:hypothetical protein